MGSKNFKTFLFGIIFSLLVGICQLSLAQQSKIDSLKVEINKAKDDTTHIFLLNMLGWQLMNQNLDTSIVLGLQTLKIAERTKHKKSIANTNSNLGAYYYIKGEYSLSLSHHFKALEITKKWNYKRRIAVSLINIGLVFWRQGDYPNALNYYFEV
ncbi:MAG: hypothetical protein COC01_06385 [Bacteroidetes bacterium]|nr:MAG: hypothetical protein COC01_06385 [Bacteroidota bacterium]